MGLTLAKCPSCGAELNLETDRDYFYCPHCGSKVLQQNERIVIEHVNRTVDEAQMRKIELEERIRQDKKQEELERDIALRKFGKVTTIASAVGFLASYLADNSLQPIIRMLALSFAFVGIAFWTTGAHKQR